VSGCGGWQEKGEANMSILARLSTQQTAIAIKPRRGAVDLAPKFVADLANIHILAAIASCLDHQISSRRGREKLSLRPQGSSESYLLLTAWSDLPSNRT
jgi:hypothetical protein